MDDRTRRDVIQTYDLAIGFVGFFGLAFFAFTLWNELAHKDALIYSLTTLFLVIVTGAIWFARRRLRARVTGSDGTNSTNNQ